jgi:hypothetical protein
MVPVIYTTYGMAMGHRPEALAASGGLRPAAGPRMPAHAGRLRGARVRHWLGIVWVRVRLRHRDADIRTAGAHGMRAAVLPSTQ